MSDELEGHVIRPTSVTFHGNAEELPNDRVRCMCGAIVKGYLFRYHMNHTEDPIGWESPPRTIREQSPHTAPRKHWAQR